MTTVTAPGNKMVRRFTVDVFELENGNLCIDTYECFGAGKANIARNFIHKDDRDPAEEDKMIVHCLKQQIETIYPVKEPIE